MISILYLSLSNPEYSVNKVYIKGLKENGVRVEDFFPIRKDFLRYLEVIKYYFKNRSQADVVMVGYENPQLVILLRLFSRKKIIYNALCSVYERLIVSRGLAEKFSVKALFYWLLDFLAVRAASLTMLETDNQIEYFSKLFKISKKKLFRAWTGVDDESFFYDPAIKKQSRFTVVFRGRLLPEAGAEYVVKAAKLLEKEALDFIMLANGQEIEKIKGLIKALAPLNLRLIEEFMPIEKLRGITQSSHLSLGQLSDHQRLERTIPHKAYESLAMKLPYLTAANSGILELLIPDKTCLTCNPADAESLAEKILWAKNNYSLVERIAENGYELFKCSLTPQILAWKLLEKLGINKLKSK